MKEATIRLATANELDAVAQFYRTTGYSGGVDPQDQVLIALLGGQKIVGVVRLCSEHGVTVLRGMQVTQRYQRLGIGTALLRGLEPMLVKRDCYCLPFAHLEGFYSLAGFRVADERRMPAFLVQRVARYRLEGAAICPMFRSRR